MLSSPLRCVRCSVIKIGSQIVSKGENIDKKENLPTIRVEKKLLVYSIPDGGVKVEILLQDENLWFSQDRIAELFGIERSVVTKHLQNIFEEGELDKNTTCAKTAQVREEGNREVTRNIEFYNLDTIIAVR